MDKTKILIADDQPLTRDGLAAILSMENNYNVVAKTGDGLTTIAQVQTHRPNLVLMDIHMPRLDGLQATMQIKADFPDTKIIILTTFDDEEYIWEALRHGASGFLVKGVETETILSTVRECLEGRINYPSTIQNRLVQALHSPESFKNKIDKETITLSSGQQHLEVTKTFTIQERNIIKMLKQGKSNQDIASELLLTKGTVKNYLSTIYKKLNVTSRAEAIVYLLMNDL